MIRLKENEDCCGCSSCVQICSRQSIQMKEDEEGFLYPEINRKTCIDCGVCEKICPVINQNASRKPVSVYGAQNKNELIRLQSSSGGVFTLLGEYVIKRKGVVFGARFNDQWNVVHDYTDNLQDIALFRGSKYVQSHIGNAYKDAERFLKEGRVVLFSGTPCQIAGLKSFLRKDYPNLLTVDFVCHGVPSPKIWQMYLKEQLFSITNPASIINPESEITHIDFRSKMQGWRNFSFVIKDTKSKENGILLSQPLSKNTFLRGFLNNLYLRPSCHQCSFRSFKSGSDIVIADFWAIGHYHPEIKNDDKGISLIMIMSQQGETIFSQIQDRLNCWTSTLEIAQKVNPCIYKDTVAHKNRDSFFKETLETESIIQLIRKNIKRSVLKKTVVLLGRISNRLKFVLERL